MIGMFWTTSGGISSWAAVSLDPEQGAQVGEPAAARRQHFVDRRVHLELPLIVASGSKLEHTIQVHEIGSVDTKERW